ncbi:CRISPR-associated endonuclease Cas4g/Cas1g [Actinoplanes regularis]|uniref:CRISPR-associated endonuclease Cas1 n=1 Tax=Actinoplanes regularis TaxID=52697 RepID=A0A239IUZ5_9ACTN|nr:CRISPR-associated endonuclease Cas1 [Actinoplanes regularis]GIE91583.1 CRISPR-associated exonuclease Cas4/endonuclease Cas1 fusion [Actinoplanes regularis]SNS97399.1 CRISP-associated protein Cas1 [Actinoplanes regularis]
MVSPARPPQPGLPETVPARMVNKFVYCPRLFYLEWVQGRFATSDDVEEGRWIHRVVDEPGGDLPDPETDLECFAGRTSRSFWITSTDLGVSAKIDIVEISDDGTVIPVDYKKGAPDRHGKAWPADEIQSVLQALLLQEAGYRVRKAEIWYAETRRRVEIPIDETRLQDVHQLMQRLWQTAASDTMPAPLQDSPKCPRCSLVGLCLPDEINTLRIRQQTAQRPRGVMAADPDSRPVYVMEQGTVVGIRRGRLETYKQDEKLASYRLIDVQQLCLYGNITVTPQAMRELLAREIPVCWFSYGGWFSGMAQGLPSKHVELRRSQYTATPETLLAAAGSMIEGKIKNCRTLLRRNSRTPTGQAIDQLADLATAATTPAGYPSLLGFEGTAARIYFSRFSGMLSENTGLDTTAFDTNGRARRPPPDPVNALLSFTYALLVKDLTSTLATIGFDPYYGVFHRPRYGRPALALDLAEEFRPLIADSTVIQLINNGEIRPTHFTGGCQLDRDGRRAVITAYERRMAHEIKHPVFGYRVNYRRALDVQGRILAAHLTGELPAYTPFTTR